MQKIIEKQCDYVISLKGNQESLYDDVRLYFETALQEPELYSIAHTSTLEKGHGRVEKREYYFTQDVEWIENRSDWANLNAIGMVRSTRIVEGEKKNGIAIFYCILDRCDRFCKGSQKALGH